MKDNAPLAVWSLILGIVSIMACGPVTGVPAIICGHMARARIKMESDKLTGDGMAMAGLIMGYFSVVFFILAVFAMIMLGIMLPVFINMIKGMDSGSTVSSSTMVINMLASCV